MAVIVDPARLDAHRRGDEGREKGGFGHLFGILAIEHGGNFGGFRAACKSNTRHCERSEAIQSFPRTLDCFVAPLLAMTRGGLTRPRAAATLFAIIAAREQ